MKFLKILFVLSLALILTSCDFFNDLKNLQVVKNFRHNNPIEINNTSNNTNSTSPLVIMPEPLKSVYPNESLKNVFIISGNSLLVVDKKTTYVIDVPKEDPKVVEYLTDFNITELEFIAVTLDKEEHNGGVQYIAAKSIPKIIYDNGIENEYRSNYIYRLDKYNQYWNRTATQYIVFVDDFAYGDFEFFVPYSRGLSTIKEENSIVVLYYKKILYMSDCYGECESKIPPIKADYIILANNGKCPTNSFDFVLNTNAKYVVGDEICSDLKDELDMIGIKHMSIAENGIIQILISDKDEIRRKT